MRTAAKEWNKLWRVLTFPKTLVLASQAWRYRQKICCNHDEICETLFDTIVSDNNHRLFKLLPAYGKPYWKKVVENNFVGREIILSLEIYFRWSRNIFDNWENFFLGREIILSDEKYYGSPEIFERIEKTFSSVKQFFLMIENFLVDWELILSIENFFVGRKCFCRSRNFCAQSLKVLKLDQQTRSNTNLLMFYLSWL